MKTILITNEEDRAFRFHKEDPNINHFCPSILQKVEMADDWIHIMPMRIKLMKSRYNESLEDIRKLISMKVCM